MNDYITRSLLKMSNRGIGKTYNLAKTVRDSNGIMICINKREAIRVKEEYNIETLSISDVERGLALSRNKPIFYDQDCILKLEEDRYAEIKYLKDQVNDLYYKLNQIRKILK